MEGGRGKGTMGDSEGGNGVGARGRMRGEGAEAGRAWGGAREGREGGRKEGQRRGGYAGRVDYCTARRATVQHGRPLHGNNHKNTNISNNLLERQRDSWGV